ncbi:MAG: dienelactone hydrolase family protein [Chloroflexi bacterium]|nr:dienelactone hydrolase family protein [Chloroflexota bacterium]
MGQDVTFASNGGRATGYLSRPQSGRGPGVLVIQEWWGLNSHVRSVADRFAVEGFVALAPDLYHGVTTREPDEAGKLLMALDIDRAARDLTGAARYLAASGATGASVGAIGFCMGGQLALYAATVAPEKIGAVIDCYGVHPNVKPDLSRLRAPVLGLFAEKDGFVTPAVARYLERRLREAGRDVEIHIYPGVDHAFFNDERPEVYDAAAANDLWRRSLAFLHEHL